MDVLPLGSTGSACFEPASGLSLPCSSFLSGERKRSKSDSSDSHFQVYLFPAISLGKKHSESLHSSQQKVQKRMVW